MRRPALPRAFSLSRQRPLTWLLSLTILAPPLTRSLDENNIGVKGTSALAAVLKETKITTLGCAPTRQCSPFCERPLTRLLIRHSRSDPRSHSLDWNKIGVKGASALAAILNETQITKLRCAAP